MRVSIPPLTCHCLSILLIVLRALAESRVAWAFWPSGTDSSSTSTAHGIWIPGSAFEEEKEDDSSDAEASVHSDDDGTPEDSMSESEKEDSEVEATGAGRFAMLSLVEDSSDEASEEEADTET